MILLQRDPQILGRDLIAPIPLMLEVCAFVGKESDGGLGVAVSMLRAMSRVVSRSSLMMPS